MSRFKLLRKFLQYYVAVAAAGWGVIATLKLAPEINVLVVAAAFLAPIVGGYVWIEGQDESHEQREIKRELSESSFILELIDALTECRYGDVNDEEIAELANNIVHKDLDKLAIKYLEYKRWRRKNNCIFVSIVSKNNELIGFFDIFPLTVDAADRILSGSLKERHLRDSDIVGAKENCHCRDIYIASLLINRNQKSFSPKIAREIVVLKIYEYLNKTFGPVTERRFIAYAHTKMGERLLHRAGFTVVSRAKDNAQRRPLFVLDPGETTIALKRYSRICRRLIALAA